MSDEKDENKGTDTMSHQAGTDKGEEAISNHGEEPGRSSGGRTARDSTSINADAEEPIDEKMPHMPPA